VVTVITNKQFLHCSKKIIFQELLSLLIYSVIARKTMRFIMNVIVARQNVFRAKCEILLLTILFTYSLSFSAIVKACFK